LNQFALVPCSKCGTQVHVSPMAGMGYCPKCMSQVAMPPGGAPMVAYGAPAAQPGPQQPQQQNPQQQNPYGAPPGQGAAQPQQNPYGTPPGQAAQPQAQYGAPPGGGHPQAGGFPAPGGFPAVGGFPVAGGGGSKLKMMGGGLLTLVLVAGGIGFSLFRSKLPGGMGKDKSSLSSLKIEEESADPDKMIASVRDIARKWRKDAEFYSINVLGFRSDGTVDLSQSSSVVTVEYFSPSAVQSFDKKVRDDSIKKFIFNGYGVSYDDIWGVRERVEGGISGTPVPTCTAKKIGAILAQKGLKPGKTAHLSLDPQFAFATPGQLSYHVMSEDPKIDLHLSVADCSVTRDAK
jgi:hypothetical protein